MKAEHWTNHNGVWYRPGDEYETGAPEYNDSPLQPAAVAEPAPEEPLPAKRGRKRKTNE